MPTLRCDTCCRKQMARQEMRVDRPNARVLEVSNVDVFSRLRRAEWQAAGCACLSPFVFCTPLGPRRSRRATARSASGRSFQTHGPRVPMAVSGQRSVVTLLRTLTCPSATQRSPLACRAPSCIGPGCPGNLPNRPPDFLGNPLIPGRGAPVPQSCVCGTRCSHRASPAPSATASGQASASRHKLQIEP